MKIKKKPINTTFIFVKHSIPILRTPIIDIIESANLFNPFTISQTFPATNLPRNQGNFCHR